MYPRIITLCLVLGIVTSSYGQNNVLFKNVNPLAKDLSHYLSHTTDTLLLENKDGIFKVEIYNQQFNFSINNTSNKIEVPLYAIPQGRLVVEVMSRDKLIILNLLRNKPYVKVENNNDIVQQTDVNAVDIKVTRKDLIKKRPQLKTIETTAHKTTVKTENQNIKKRITTTDYKPKVIASSSAEQSEKPPLLNHTTFEEIELTKKNKKKERLFWVEYTIINGNSSSKIMRMASKRCVDNFIKKNKLEIQSRKGRFNKLMVWEVYDSANFIKHELSKGKLINITQSAYYNAQPYYISASLLVAQN